MKSRRCPSVPARPGEQESAAGCRGRGSQLVNDVGEGIDDLDGPVVTVRNGGGRLNDRRLLDEEAHYLLTLQWHRIIPHSSKVKGWQVTPSHYLNNTLDAVWLAE